MNKTTKGTEVLGYTISIDTLISMTRECPAGNLPGMINHRTNQAFDEKRGICLDCANAPEWSPMGKALAAAGI